jgi:hypothetical protein
VADLPAVGDQVTLPIKRPHGIEKFRYCPLWAADRPGRICVTLPEGHGGDLSQRGNLSHRTIRRFATNSLVVAVLVLASALIASPAQAYSNLTYRAAIVDTDTCHRAAGVLTVIKESGGCRINDTADGTFFRNDAGGIAIKAEIRDGSGMVAKAEFHPYGEKFWYYDTRNDGDTVYFELCTGYRDVCYGTYQAPGTSAVIDYGTREFAFDEGTRISISAYYDHTRTRLIASFGYGAALVG